MKRTNNKGITLVALVITIVILIILATVAINAVFRDGGLVYQAERAKDLADNSIARENEDMNKLEQELANLMKDDGNPELPPEVIPQTNSYVGYYADIEGDGTIDGIIYADLAIGNTGDGYWIDWTGSNQNYTIPVQTNLKDYYISKKSYSGDFGTKDVLTPLKGQSEKNDRFYIMALDDIDDSTHYWYKSAFGEMSIDTKTTFGTGRENTQIMIEQWNSNKYSPQDDNDMWGLIQTQVSKGWFVPSKEEWSAFAEELGITEDNYLGKKLNSGYWSSSQINTNSAWIVYFESPLLGRALLVRVFVRLSTTF